MSYAELKKCTIETVNETVYFDVEYEGVEYKYLTLEISECGYVALRTPSFFCPCLDGNVDFYTIYADPIRKEIKKVIWEHAKNHKIILDIIRKKYSYTGEEFKFL